MASKNFYSINQERFDWKQGYEKKFSGQSNVPTENKEKIDQTLMYQTPIKLDVMKTARNQTEKHSKKLSQIRRNYKMVVIQLARRL